MPSVELYQDNRRFGLCGRCGEFRDDPAFDMCTYCRESHRESVKTYRGNKPPGECRECKQPAKEGRTKCDRHLKLDVERWKARRARRRQEERILRDHGLDLKELDAFA